MKKHTAYIAPFALACALAVLALPHNANAETPVNDKVFGLGIQLGDPTALTMKMLFTEKFGMQMHVGGGSWWRWENMFMTGLDAVWHPVMLYDGWKTCALNLTLGVGGGLGLYRWHWHRWHWYDGHYVPDDPYWHDWGRRTHPAGYVRMVTGVSLWFKKFPLEGFIELDPAIMFFGDNPYNQRALFHMQWVGAGGRWYF